jgi:hypothetical protein
MPTHSTTIARRAERWDYRPSIEQHLEAYARAAAEARHPDHPHLQAAVDRAASAVTAASRADDAARYQHYRHLSSLGPLVHHANTGNAEAMLAELDRDIATTRTDLDQRHHTATRCERDPAILALPPGRLDTERATWAQDRERQQHEKEQAQEQAAITRAARVATGRYAGHGRSTPRHTPEPYIPRQAPAPGISR